jgi:ligand-binding SRPBCC domain-containing protein
MKIYTLEREQLVNTDLETCWEFFSKPANLKKITPNYMGFDIVRGGEGSMYAGQVIEYRVSPLLGLKQTWLTEITHVEHQHFFIDEQRVGPYKLWHHQHFFIPQENGKVLMKDIVTYALPPLPFSGLIHELVVKKKLNEIFSHRKKVVEELFN